MSPLNGTDFSSWKITFVICVKSSIFIRIFIRRQDEQWCLDTSDSNSSTQCRVCDSHYPPCLTCKGEEHPSGPEQVIPPLPKREDDTERAQDHEEQTEDGDGGCWDVVLCKRDGWSRDRKVAAIYNWGRNRTGGCSMVYIISVSGSHSVELWYRQLAFILAPFEKQQPCVALMLFAWQRRCCRLSSRRLEHVSHLPSCLSDKDNLVFPSQHPNCDRNDPWSILFFSAPRLWNNTKCKTTLHSVSPV